MGPFKRGGIGALCLVSAVGVGWGGGIGAASQDQWIWPMEIKPALSATFAESRGAAFHAGIDIKTWGRTGYAVKAIADGYVMRLRTSPWGYGRAVYQKLADGRIVVYAHLQEFNDVLTAQVEKAQAQKGRYTTDQWFEAGEMPIARGQVIALSGQSGAGPPHLHLELRDAGNVPINPLLHGFTIPDTVSPSIRRLALIPQGIGSRVNGGHEPVIVGLRFDQDQGLYVAADTVSAYGIVGIAVHTYDRADGVPNKLAPYRQLLSVDGVPVFAAAYQRVAYRDAYQALLDRTWLPVADGQAVFFNLFKFSGNRLKFYYRNQQDGWLHCTADGLGKGLHRIDLETADVAGNISRARLQLMVHEAPDLWSRHFLEGKEFIEVGLVGPDNGENSATAFFEVERQPYRDFVQVSIRSPVVLAKPPLVVAQSETLQVEQWDLKAYRFDLGLTPNSGSVRSAVVNGRGRLGQKLQTLVAVQQRPVFPDRSARLAFDSTAVLFFPEQSVYELFFPQGEALVPDKTEGWLSYGIGYRFGALSVSFNRKVEVWLRYPKAVARPQQLGIYALSYKGDWGFIGNEWNAEQALVGAKVRQLGTYALLADTTGPEVKALQPAPGQRVATLRPRLVAQVSDQGAGLGSEEDIIMALDGRRLISEYDPDASQVFYQVKNNLALGAHRLEVRVKDRSGNQTVAAAQFTIVR
jgi:hypothetical protein